MAPGTYSITAPAGFGKTALLANWSTSGKVEADICYQFISRADATADEDFTLLWLRHQLMRFHGLTGDLPSRTTELRALFPVLLATPPPVGKRLVVVIDGLDEALNWKPGPDLFTEVPDGITVVLSAREEAGVDWARTLRLDERRIQRLTLPALDASGIADLLRRAGAKAADLAQDQIAVTRLLAKSGGDPLYLRLLVEDVQEGRIGVTQIEAQPSGLDGYLDRWWEEFREEVNVFVTEVYNVVGVLSVAKGPLLPTELARIRGSLQKQMMVRTALEGKVRRYVVGDERWGDPIGHPKFRDHLASKFGDSERYEYLNELVDFCAEWRKHKCPYALSYYPTHLAELGRNRDLRNLLDKEWMNARWAQTRSHLAFLSDVRLAANSLTVETGSDFADFIQLMMIQASVISLAERIPAEALATLVAVGRCDDAVDYVSTIPEPTMKVRLLQRLSDAALQHELRQRATSFAVRRTIWRPRWPSGASAPKRQGSKAPLPWSPVSWQPLPRPGYMRGQTPPRCEPWASCSR